MASNKLLLPRFEGDISKVKVESWIAMFELVHDGITLDKEKIKKLISYLKDSAMDWFSDSIMPRMADNITFNTIKAEMITRFNRDLVEPIIQVQNRKLKRDETVNDYFIEKIQVLRRTGLKESGQIAMLTDGMPQHFRTPLISARPTDTNAWLSLALDLETSFRQNKKFNEFAGPRTEMVHMSDKTNKPQKKKVGLRNGSSTMGPNGRKPPGPCRYCKSRGQENWHWNNECFDQTMASPTIQGPDTVAVHMTLAKNDFSGQPH